MKNSTKNQSGKTLVENNSIIWEVDGNQVLKIPIKDIILVGEYTTSNGPYMDDWFLVFYNKKSIYFEISMYAENIHETIDHLGKVLNEKIINTLVTSAEWESNILYPKNYQGKKIWNIVDVKPASFLDKLKSFIGMKKKELELTKTVKELIE